MGPQQCSMAAALVLVFNLLLTSTVQAEVTEFSRDSDLAQLSTAEAPEIYTKYGLTEVEDMVTGGTSASNGPATASAKLDQVSNITAVPAEPAVTAGVIDIAGNVITANSTAYPTAICGDNNLGASDYKADCKIFAYWPDGSRTGCSAFILKAAEPEQTFFLGTAGHCVYTKKKGGFADNIDILCNGQDGCSGPVTARAASFAVPRNWFDDADNNQYSTPFDAAVIQSETLLPYIGYSFGTPGSCSSHSVEITGFPGSSSGGRCTPYNGCSQQSSVGEMACAIDGGWYFPTYDACSGHSGSSVYDLNVGFVTAVNSGSTQDPCRNYAVPIVLKANADNGCNGPNGGVSLKCLADFLASQ